MLGQMFPNLKTCLMVLQWRALRYLVIILQILPLAGKSPKRHRDLWGNESESNVAAVAAVVAVVAVFVLSACCASSV